MPVAAVLSDQYATITVIIGNLFLNEEPTRGQAVGYSLIILGVAAVSALQ